MKKVFYPLNRFIFGHHVLYGDFNSINGSVWKVSDKNNTRKLADLNREPISYPKINQLFSSNI